MPTVRIQVIKTYDIEIPDESPNPVKHAYAMQTTEIEEEGKLVEVQTDHAQLLEYYEYDEYAYVVGEKEDPLIALELFFDGTDGSPVGVPNARVVCPESESGEKQEWLIENYWDVRVEATPRFLASTPTPAEVEAHDKRSTT